MFNVFAHDKLVEQRLHEEQDQVKAVQTRHRNIHYRDNLSKRYRTRINHFMMAMLQNPTKMKEYKRPLEAPEREGDPSRFQGGAIFIMKGFKTEKQRIQEYLDKNEFLDLHPNPSKHSFRDYDRSKDINPRMYFKPKSTMERVRAAALYSNFLDQGEMPPPNYLQKGEGEEDVNKQGENADSTMKKKVLEAKDIFPSLHHKTHFKAVSSLMLFEGRSREMSAPSIQQIKDDILRQGTFKEEETSTIAREVLETCNLRKQLSVGYLPSGGGKLVGNPESTVGEVYSRLGSTRSLFPKALSGSRLV